MSRESENVPKKTSGLYVMMPMNKVKQTRSQETAHGMSLCYRDVYLLFPMIPSWPFYGDVKIVIVQHVQPSETVSLKLSICD